LNYLCKTSTADLKVYRQNKTSSVDKKHQFLILKFIVKMKTLSVDQTHQPPDSIVNKKNKNIVG